MSPEVIVMSLEVLCPLGSVSIFIYEALTSENVWKQEVKIRNITSLSS